MKNKLLPLIFVLGCYSAYSQGVGIGKMNPSPSAQLEVFASDKGILIPRVKLTGSTDATTITRGNVESLLVFNTETVSDVVPGYYYWFDNRWNKLVVSKEIEAAAGSVTFNAATNEFSYIDANGDSQVINMGDIVKANETLTTLVKDTANNGKYTYKSENDTQTTIDVVSDVITNASTIFNSTDVKNEITNLIESDQTVTTLTKNDPNDGKYVYKNEENTEVTIDIVGDVISNASSIFNNPAVTEIINEIAGKSVGDVTFNAATNEFSYIDADGNSQLVDISKIVKDNETVTTLVKDAANNGKYTYASENNTQTTIDVVSDVITNASTIFNSTDVKNEISNLIESDQTVTTLTKNDPNDGKYVYKNEEGTETTIDVVGDVITNASTIFNNSDVVTEITKIIESGETLTSLVYNEANNTLTYTDEKNNSNAIDLKDLVANAETNTTLVYDAAAKTLTYTGESGTPTVINLVDLVGDAETITKLEKQDAGKYLYTSEDATETTIDVVDDVITNASTIFNSTEVKSEISKLIESDQTVTTLTKNDPNDGKYVYKNEESTETTIDVVGDVISNASTIFNNSAVTTEITKIVKSGETETTLAYNATGKTLTYTGEKDTSIINLKDITTTTPDTVLAVTGTGATFAAASVDIVPSTVVGDVMTTSATGVVSWQAPAKSNVMAIEVITSNYTVTDNDYTIIGDGLTDDITISLPNPTTSKGRMLVINQLDMLKADGQTPIVVRFNYDVRYASAAVLPYLAASASGGITSGSLKVTLQSDGIKWYAITYTM